MSRLLIFKLDNMYRNKRQRWSIKRRARRMEKVIKIYDIQKNERISV